MPSKRGHARDLRLCSFPHVETLGDPKTKVALNAAPTRKARAAFRNTRWVVPLAPPLYPVRLSREKNVLRRFSESVLEL
jgi:hypothetical protein